MDTLLSKQIHIQYTHPSFPQPDNRLLATIQLTRSQNKKLIAIHITDDDDPLLLFQAEINENDFRALQTDQSLLVDFAQFPFNLIELLDECAKCQNDLSPKFLVQLSCDSASSRNATFKIMETNRFKYITYLSLTLLRASDAEVKRNLADLVNGYKSEIHTLRTQLDTTTTTLTTRLAEANSQNRSLASDLSRAQDELARLRRDLDHGSDARRDLEALEREARAAREDAAECRAAKRVAEREAEGWRTRAKEWERREREGDEWVAGEQKAKLEESLAMYKAQNTRLENSLRQTKEEINKGNEIIQRLQSDLSAARSKIKLKNVVTLQQERLLDERGATIETQTRELAEVRDALARAEAEAERERRRAEEATRGREGDRAMMEENAR
ncbi:hypothetical protein BC938DRAFT_475644, partial [Jimgerdemannia flammicorona]